MNPSSTLRETKPALTSGPAPRSSPRKSCLRGIYQRRSGLVWALLLAAACAPAQTRAQIGNTATGNGALSNNTTGNFNTADGYGALNSNTSGTFNTADGAYSLYNNTIGTSNVAAGYHALLGNTSGSYNTAVGHEALYSNTTTSFNTAVGNHALYSNTVGAYNTATGQQALYLNTTSSYNAAYGSSALRENVAGTNTAMGYQALTSNTTGPSNTAMGTGALSSNTSGDNNIGLGYLAGQNLTTGHFNIAIGAAGSAGESNTIRIGRAGTQKKTFIQGISGATVPNGVQVVVNPAGKLGTIVSSAKYKEKIKPMDNASEALLALKPVTFQYKHDLDPDGIPQFGLVAEEVEKVNPDLVARDADGKVYTVRYEAVNAMLLNEFLKEHRTVEEQGAAMREQKATIAELKARDAQQGATLLEQQKQIDSLNAGLRKVSHQMQLTNPDAKLVAH